MLRARRTGNAMGAEVIGADVPRDLNGEVRMSSFLIFSRFIHPCACVIAPAMTAMLALLCSASSLAAGYPQPKEDNYIIRDFKFSTGEILPQLKLHYATIGTPMLDTAGAPTNAVLLLHGTAGSSAGFLTDAFAGTLFGAGQPLDATRYFIIIPDSIGHGQSSKPSDGLHARFPAYTYDDMVLAQHRLLTEKLGVHHLRLVIGTSMGGMHSLDVGSRLSAIHGRRATAGLPAGADRGAQPNAATSPRRI